MIISKRSFFTLFAIIAIKISWAQSLDYKINTLSNESSITNNHASSFYKDKEGFLWVGKMDGLYKYNGYDFEIFSNTFNSNRGLSNPWITDVNGFKDYLIVGTKNGLNFLNKATEKFSYIFPSDVNPEFSNHITCINVNAENNQILVGTINGFFLVLFHEDQTFTMKQLNFEGCKSPNDIPEVYQILTVPGGTIIRSSKKLFLLKTGSTVARRMKIEIESGKSIESFNTLYLTKSSELLIFCPGETFFSNLKKQNFHPEIVLKALKIRYLYDNWPKP